MLTINTPIKINLALHVLGHTKHNYLSLDSLVVFSANGDEIQLHLSDQDSFTVTGPYKFQLQGENLVIKARNLLRNYAKIHSPVAINLNKNLPVSSGLGGGSGDGAATLFALNQLWSLNLCSTTLLNLAVQLGADVPCCLYYLFHKTAIYMEGIGEIITPIKSLPKLNILIVNSLEQTSTKEVCSKIENKNNSAIHKIYDFKTLQDFIKFLKHTRNDLYASAVRLSPSIDLTLKELKENSLFYTMSGSGASCVAIYETKEQTEFTARNIKNKYPSWFVKTIYI